MRRNIELLSIAITVVIFIVINSIMLTLFPNNATGTNDMFAYVAMAVIIALVLILGFYVLLKQKKNKEVIL